MIVKMSGKEKELLHTLKNSNKKFIVLITINLIKKGAHKKCTKQSLLS